MLIKNKNKRMGKGIFYILALLGGINPLMADVKILTPPPLPSFKLESKTEPQKAPDTQPDETIKTRIYVDDSGMRENIFFQIVFKIGPQTKAVVFEKDKSFYILLDCPLDLPNLKFPKDLATLTQIDKKDTYTIFKLNLNDKYLTPEFQKFEEGWNINISPKLKDIPEDLDLVYQATSKDPQTATITTGITTPLITFLLDNQEYTALPHTTHGVHQGFTNRAFGIVPAWVGLILVKNNPQVSITQDKETIKISQSTPLPLLFSDKLPANYYPSSPPPILDLRKWDIDPQLTVKMLQSLELQLSELDSSDPKAIALIKDIGKLYLSMGLYNEALGQAQQIYMYHPEHDSPEVAFLHDIALIFAHPNYEFDYPKTALNYSQESEYALLKAIDMHYKNIPEKALPAFADALKTIQNFPRPLRNAVSLMALEASLVAKKPEVVFKGLVTQGFLTPRDRDLFTYLDAKLNLVAHNNKAAIPVLKDLVKSPNLLVQFQSQLDLITAQPIDLKKAIHQMEELKFLWRGDMFEVNFLKQLAQAYEQAKDNHKAILTYLTLQEYLSKFIDPQENLTKVTDLIFAELQKFSPKELFKKIAFYYEFDDYLPTDERLLSITAQIIPDLLTLKLNRRAIDILNKKVDLLTALGKQKNTPEKYAPILGQIRMQLGSVYLEDGQPQKSLDTFALIPDSSITADDRLKIMMSKVRAMAQLSQYDQALSLIETGLQMPNASAHQEELQRLKAKIHMSQEKWDEAIAGLEPMVLPLKEKADPINVLDLAVSYASQNNQPKMDELQKLCVDCFKDKNQKDAFLLLTTPPKTSEVSKTSLEEQLKAAENIAKVMEALRKDYFK